MKVFVSGIGSVSGIGLNVEEHLQAFRDMKNGMAPVTLFSTRRTVPVSEVKADNNRLKEIAGIDPAKTYSRTALLGIVAANEAWKDAAIENSRKWRIGLISSTSNGGMDLTEQFYPLFRTNPFKGRLRHVIHHDAGDSTEQIANYIGLTGFRTTISTACSSAANAILLGSRLIEQDILDIVIAGGTDALCKFTLNGFNSLLILDKEATRPFDESRAGLNLGEGAGYLVLQGEHTMPHTTYCEIAGYGNANDAFHQTASSEEGTGASLAIQKALAKAKIKPEDISYINAHGTGTPNNDASESAALINVFGDNIPPFSSTKPLTGHTLGAAGGIEAVFSVLAIKHGILFGNYNFQDPISTTGLIPQTGLQENREINAVLSNSFGFGGNNTALIFRKLTEYKQRFESKTVSRKKDIYINTIASNYQLIKDENGDYIFTVINSQPDKQLVPNATVRRRMSRLIKMGVATALECLKSTPDIKPDAILTGTGLGCLADTEKFMNNLLDNNEELLTPTAFIQSTFNTVGAQIALLTKNHEYNNTYVHRGLSLESAFLDGIVLLQEKDIKNVLCGSIDELIPLLDTLYKRVQGRKQTKAGEGSAFFMLSNEKNEHSYAQLKAIETFSGSYSKEEIGERITAFLSGNNCADARIVYPDTFKKLCGEFPTAVSFALWQVLSEMKSEGNSKPILIYNNFIENHSFILLNPV